MGQTVKRLYLYECHFWWDKIFRSDLVLGYFSGCRLSDRNSIRGLHESLRFKRGENPKSGGGGVMVPGLGWDRVRRSWLDAQSWAAWSQIRGLLSTEYEMRGLQTQSSSNTSKPYLLFLLSFTVMLLLVNNAKSFCIRFLFEEKFGLNQSFEWSNVEMVCAGGSDFRWVETMF